MKPTFRTTLLLLCPAALPVACAIDFDAPFEQTAGNITGGSAGEAGSGGFAKTGGTAGSVTSGGTGGGGVTGGAGGVAGTGAAGGSAGSSTGGSAGSGGSDGGGGETGGTGGETGGTGGETGGTGGETGGSAGSAGTGGTGVGGGSGTGGGIGCGNDECDGDETCATCEDDCGACAPCGASPSGAVDTRTMYATASVPYGQTCQSETQERVCFDGQWSGWTGTFTFDACVVDPPLCTSFGVSPELAALPGGPYQNCQGGTIPRITISEGTGSWSGCCSWLVRECYVSGSSVQNQMYCDDNAPDWCKPDPNDVCTDIP